VIRLRQTFGAHAGRVLELDRACVRLGRLPDCEVAFDPHADLDASGRHAEIRAEAGGYRLVDVGSRNGTFVNGARVSEAVLAEGDEIELGLGGPRLRVEAVAPGTGAGVAPDSLPRGPSIPPTLRPTPSARPSVPPTPDARGLARAFAAISAPPAAPAPEAPPRRRRLLVGLLLALLVAGAILGALLR